MIVLVKIPSSLRKLTAGSQDLSISSESIHQVFAYLKMHYSELYDNICLPSGEIRPFVKIFLNKTECRKLDEDDVALKSGDVVSIITAIAGG